MTKKRTSQFQELSHQVTLDKSRNLDNSIQPTILDNLTEEVLMSVHNKSIKKEVEKKISEFLKEESIINRTKDCNQYFKNYITAKALVKEDNNVRFKPFLQICCVF